MSALVTIIVPIYNVESYIRKCVESVINQTYRDLEIVLVDDGSTDHCPIICDEYKTKDCRVKVVHKANGGLSDARNAGLDIATGDYITFLDGDDYYEPETIQKLLEMVERDSADVVSYGAIIVDEHYISKYREKPVKERLSFQAYLRLMFQGLRSPSVCTKLYSKSAIGDHRFLKGRLNEDFYFSTELFLNDGVISTAPFAGYNYYQRNGSISHSGRNNTSVMDAIINCIELHEAVLCRAKEMEAPLANMALHQASVLLRIIPEKHITKNNEKLLIASKCIEEFSPLLKDSGISIYEKAIIQIARRMPVATVRILRIIRSFKK